MAVRLLLDPGGTRLKFARVEGGKILHVDHVTWAHLAASGENGWVPSPAWSVMGFTDCHVFKRNAPPAAPSNWLETFLTAFGLNPSACQVLDPIATSGLDVNYSHGQPGSDRISAAFACYQKNPAGRFVIIDAGTCITIDLLESKHWRGGAILPGISLQASSMRHAGLPEIKPDASMLWKVPSGPEGALGTDTEGAIRAGILWAVRRSVEAVVRALQTFAPDAEVVLTGGDAQHFEGLGGWRTFADPNLVLRGGALLLNESIS